MGLIDRIYGLADWLSAVSERGRSAYDFVNEPMASMRSSSRRTQKGRASSAPTKQYQPQNPDEALEYGVLNAAAKKTAFKELAPQMATDIACGLEGAIAVFMGCLYCRPLDCEIDRPLELPDSVDEYTAAFCCEVDADYAAGEGHEGLWEIVNYANRIEPLNGLGHLKFEFLDVLTTEYNYPQIGWDDQIMEVFFKPATDKVNERFEHIRDEYLNPMAEEIQALEDLVKMGSMTEEIATGISTNFPDLGEMYCEDAVAEIQDLADEICEDFTDAIDDYFYGLLDGKDDGPFKAFCTARGILFTKNGALA